MGDFFAELRRRHIYRIGAGYVVVAWGITQSTRIPKFGKHLEVGNTIIAGQCGSFRG